MLKSIEIVHIYGLKKIIVQPSISRYLLPFIFQRAKASFSQWVCMEICLIPSKPLQNLCGLLHMFFQFFIINFHAELDYSKKREKISMNGNWSDPFKNVPKSLPPPFLQLSPPIFYWYCSYICPERNSFFLLQPPITYNIFFLSFFFGQWACIEICLIPFKAVQSKISADSFTSFSQIYSQTDRQLNSFTS